MEAKFPETLSDFENLLKNVGASAGICSPLPPDTAPDLPDKDRPVLAAAIYHGCQALITGDKTHFDPLYGQAIHGVEIHSPASFAMKLGE